MATNHPEQGIHLVRAFPRWYTDGHGGDHDIYRQYNAGIGEWGYYLQECVTLRGKYPGQMDRCWWTSLPKPNLLRAIPTSVKGFALGELDSNVKEGDFRFVLERVSEDGLQVELFKLEMS
jgi:hypothetical protein